MPVTFVTAFLDLNNIENRPNHKNTVFYIKKGLELLSFPHSFVVFIDAESLELIPKEFKSMPNITFHTIDIKTLPVYHLTNPELSLPMGRNKEKDTYNYLCINISKTYLVEKAIDINPYQSTHFAWIDIGVMHIIKDTPIEKESFKESLYAISNYNEKRIRLPGCFDPLRLQNTSFLSYKDYPCWAFCGGLFCGEKESLRLFSKDVLSVLENLDFMTWEVNIWTYLYNKKKELFDWYGADHNISMFSNF